MTYSNLFRRCPAMLIVISAALGVSTAAAASVDDPVIFSLDRSAGSTIQDRDPGYRPLYLVYADTQRTAEEAKKLVDDLGMTQNLDAYKTRVFVVGPSNGTAYDDTADLTAYQNFLKSHRSSNLKIVAVGAGATFVNNVISKHAYSVAGILNLRRLDRLWQCVEHARTSLCALDERGCREAVHTSERSHGQG